MCVLYNRWLQEAMVWQWLDFQLQKEFIDSAQALDEVCIYDLYCIYK